MSCFKLPKGLIKDLEVLIRKFWWAYNGKNRKTHWEKWERLCEAKEVGGMRFKEIEKFNEALLAKQVWCMINNPNSLCHRVFKARFFPEYSILEAQGFNYGVLCVEKYHQCKECDSKRYGMAHRNKGCNADSRG